MGLNNLMGISREKSLLSGMFLFMALILMSASANAEENAPLGRGNVALKTGVIFFTNFEGGDAGFYIGAEGYGKVMPNIYLGGEVGAASGISIFGLADDITIAPIEINLKYAIEPVSNLVLDFGAGPSFIYSTVESSVFDEDIQESDWLFGGQFFADAVYKIKWFFIGANVKYQITQDFKDTDYSASNLRVGAKLGVTF